MPRSVSGFRRKQSEKSERRFQRIAGASRTGLPGRAPVSEPSRRTATPFTNTSLKPVA
jgi:hypothetical protein